MSAVGNLDYFKSNNKSPNILNVSDMTLSELITNYQILPKNSLVVSSPQTKAGVDNQKPALAITDANGQVLPLSYSFNSTYFEYNNTNNTISLSWTFLKRLNELESMTNRLRDELNNVYTTYFSYTSYFEQNK